MDEDQAASRIQAVHRGRQARESFQVREPNQSTCGGEAVWMKTRRHPIQAVHRGRQAREEAAEMRRSQTNQLIMLEIGYLDEDPAAAKIQAVHRGRQAREEAAKLRRNQISEPSNLGDRETPGQSAIPKKKKKSLHHLARRITRKSIHHAKKRIKHRLKSQSDSAPALDRKINSNSEISIVASAGSTGIYVNSNPAAANEDSIELSTATAASVVEQWNSETTGDIGLPVETRSSVLRKSSCETNEISRSIAYGCEDYDEAVARGTIQHDGYVMTKRKNIMKNGSGCVNVMMTVHIRPKLGNERADDDEMLDEDGSGGGDRF